MIVFHDGGDLEEGGLCYRCIYVIKLVGFMRLLSIALVYDLLVE